jgi:hypothetical protein
MVSSSSQAVRNTLLAAALQTGLVAAHFGYSAHAYDDPGRLHAIAPAAGFLVLAVALGGLCVWRPGPWTLWPLVAEVGAVFVGIFGGYHGGFSHAGKDLLYLAGTSPERLTEIFDSPDFAPPDDLVFELSGLLTLGAAIVVAVCLVRLVRAARTPAVRPWA